MDVDWRGTALGGQPLLDLLLLLKRLYKGRLQAIRVLCFKCLLHVRRYALLANHFRFFVTA